MKRIPVEGKLHFCGTVRTCKCVYLLSDGKTLAGWFGQKSKLRGELGEIYGWFLKPLGKCWAPMENFEKAFPSRWARYDEKELARFR
ncbi:MAG: hypothetical protein ACYTBZ_24355 [Planctomycetota bacterium]|jgi:hypothetical protein